MKLAAPTRLAILSLLFARLTKALAEREPREKRSDLTPLEMCRKLGYNPISAMIRMANNRKLDAAIRLRAHAEIAPYLYARKAPDALAGGFQAIQLIVLDAGSEIPAQIQRALPAQTIEIREDS